ncbi:LCP family protein [Streptacidiphilus sp. 4-A2]|nr:LCP family protein [Streptacidiphilus sp. 4-A2]
MTNEDFPQPERSGGRSARRRGATSGTGPADRGGDRGSRGSGRATRRRRRLKTAGLIVAGLLVVGAGTGAYAYEHIFGQIQSVSLDSLKNRPAASKANAEGQTPLNILVLGSQTRDGQHGVNLGNSSKDGTNLSDTAMLVHLSADRKWSVVASIPRDLIVPRPQCNQRVGIGNQTNGNVVPGSSDDMFDAAMSLGGPSCAVATVEQMTGIRVDHFVEIDFNAFQSLTDDVGGVQVCVPEPGINDPNYSGLVLSAGLHTISGAESLEFVRDRHGIGDGTDLGRIQMQQMFVSSLFKKLSSNGTLTDPVTLFKIATDVASNMTVDSALDSPTAMVSMAESVKGLNSKYMQYITAPYEFDPNDVNRVIPGQGFDQVWNDLRADEPLPGSAAATAFGTTAKAAPKPSASPTGVPLSAITVSVYNGTTAGTAGLAGNAVAVLKAQGVKAGVGGDATGTATTEIQYPAGQEAQAKALQNDIPGAQLQADSNVSVLTWCSATTPRPTSVTRRPPRPPGPPPRPRPPSARRAARATRTSAPTCPPRSTTAARPATGDPRPSLCAAADDVERHLSAVICRLSSLSRRPSAVIPHLSAVSRQPSAVSRQSVITGIADA